MRVGLIVAMDKEFDIIAKEWIAKSPEERVIKTSSGCKWMKLRPTDTDEVIIMQCGIGKVNAAVGVMTLARMRVDCVISSGVAGGTYPQNKAGLVVVGTQYMYHDVYCGQEIAKGQVQGEPERFFADENLERIAQDLSSGYLFGQIVTGDQFVDNKQGMGRILDEFPEAIAVDMESCAMAQACSKRNIPFISFRIISDVVLGGEAYKDFWTQAPVAMACNTMQYVMKVIREYTPV